MRITKRTMTNAIAQAAAVVSGDTIEAERLAKRRELRAELGRRKLDEKRYRELHAEIDAVNARVDRADAAHATKVGELRRKLAAVENRIIDAELAHKPADETDEAERTALLSQIAEQNRLLATVVSECNELRSVLLRDARHLGEAMAKGVGIESKLSGEELGNPALLDQLFAAKSALTFAQARRQSAMAAAEKNQSRISEVRRHPRRFESHVLPEYEKRARRWQLEIAEAQAAVNDANQRIDAIRQKLVDE